MPVSSAAWYVHWIIYFKFFLANRAPLWLLERNARKSFGPENSPEVLPSAITTNDKISVEREVFSAGQEWEVFHVAPTGDEREKKVVVYWHGGAFIKRTAPLHWDAIARIAVESKCPVVVPIYTLAPLSTAREWEQTALDIVLALSKDKQYAGHQIVLMGDSAGGWMSMRLLQAMCEIGLDDKSGRQEAINTAFKSMGTAIMISPLINPEVNDELIEASQSDCWLSLNLFKFVNRLWVNGPGEYPSILNALPAEAKERYANFPKMDTYSYETCLDKNLDIFKSYADRYPEHGPFRFTTFIGTADMCHRPVLKLQKSFEAMDAKAVVSDTTIEEGLYHVYPLITTPEADRAWEKIRGVLES